MPANAGYSLSVPGDGPEVHITLMEISRPQLSELTELLEDTIEYFCDNNQISGQLAWTVAQCLSTAKLAEMNGELANV